MRWTHKLPISIAFVLVFAAGLAGCKTTELVATSIGQVCSNYREASFTFDALTLTGRIPASTIAKKQRALAAIEAVCSNPPANPRQALSTALRVFAQLVDATAEARKAAGG